MARLPPVPADDIAHILSNAEDDLRELAGSRLFITGGTGFIGTWLLETLAAANSCLGTRISVVVLSRNPEKFASRSPHLAENRNLSLTAGDVREFLPPPGHFDFIIHAATAASAAFNQAAPREMFSTIVAGTARVLEFAEQTGAQHLYLSSGAVYGQQPADIDRMSESYAGAPNVMDPASAYAEGKRSAELLCATTPGIASKIARCFAFIGPHLPLNAHFAAGNFIRDALHHRTIVVQGDGRPLRSYLYAADLVIWLFAILVRGTALRPYNVGSDYAVSIADLAKRVAHQAPVSVPVKIMSSPTSDLSPRYVPDTQRATRELGLRQQIDLDAAIARTLSWHRHS